MRVDSVERLLLAVGIPDDDMDILREGYDLSTLKGLRSVGMVFTNREDPNLAQRTHYTIANLLSFLELRYANWIRSLTSPDGEVGRHDVWAKMLQLFDVSDWYALEMPEFTLWPEGRERAQTNIKLWHQYPGMEVNPRYFFDPIFDSVGLGNDVRVLVTATNGINDMMGLAVWLSQISRKMRVIKKKYKCPLNAEDWRLLKATCIVFFSQLSFSNKQQTGLSQMSHFMTQRRGNYDQFGSEVLAKEAWHKKRSLHQHFDHVFISLKKELTIAHNNAVLERSKFLLGAATLDRFSEVCIRQVVDGVSKKDIEYHNAALAFSHGAHVTKMDL